MQSTYNLEEGEEERGGKWWNFLWRSNIHERTKFFLWKLANNGLPLLSNLASKGMNLEHVDCVHGCPCVENEIYVFFHCEVATKILYASPWGIRWERVVNNDLFHFLKCFFHFLKCLACPKGILPVQLEDKEEFFVSNVITMEHISGLETKRLMKV